MAYMRTEVYSTDRNILASEVGLVQKTKQALKSMATKNEEDKYILAQGLFWLKIKMWDLWNYICK